MKTIGENGEQILTVEDFGETDKLISDFRKMESDNKKYEEQLNTATEKYEEYKADAEAEINLVKETANTEITELREQLKEKLNVDNEASKEDYKELTEKSNRINKYIESRDESIKKIQSLVKKKESALKGRKTTLEKKIANNNKEIKNYASDERLKSITQEMMKIEAEIKNEELLLKKKDVELQEFYSEEKHEDPLKWQKIYNQQDEIKANIGKLKEKLKEYSNFKQEIFDIKFPKKTIRINNPVKESETVQKPQTEAVQEPTSEPEIAQETEQEITSEPEPTQEPASEPAQTNDPVVFGTITKDPVTEKLYNNKPLKIVLGNNGKVIYNGSEYEISTKTIRRGLLLNNELRSSNLTDKKLQRALKGINPDIIRKLSENTFDLETPMDFSVILSINEMDITKEERENLMSGYIVNAIKSQAEKKAAMGEKIEFMETGYGKGYSREDIDVIYDMNNLSKVSLFKTLFSRNPLSINLSKEEKESFVELANRANHYGLGKTVGQYKESFSNKIVNFFRGRKNNLLPEPDKMKTIDMTDQTTIEETADLDDIHDVARYYNDNVHGKISSKEDFKKALKDGVEDYAINNAEDDKAYELKHLGISQYKNYKRKQEER